MDKKTNNITTKIPKVKIPYLNLPDKPIIAKTQDFLPIADIIDDIVLTKDGGACLVLESSSLNFGLLSEKEQQAVIFAYSAFLNSLSFPIQIIIRSQVKDISKYMEYLEKAREKITNPKLAGVMDNYKSFVRNTIKKKNILGKNFYIVIPFTPLELGIAKSAASITKRGGSLPFPKSYVIKKSKIALYPKRDHLIKQVSRLGIKLRQLSTAELIQLYYNVSNAKPPSIRSKEIKEKL